MGSTASTRKHLDPPAQQQAQPSSPSNLVLPFPPQISPQVPGERGAFSAPATGEVAMLEGFDMDKWIRGLAVHNVLSESQKTTRDGRGDFEYLVGISREEQCLDHLLQRAVAGLREMLVRESRILVSAAATQETGSNNGKFTHIVGRFGTDKDFHSGLEVRIGLPNPRILQAMKREHCTSADSMDTFTSTNYGGTSTTPFTEWEFVTSPVEGKVYPGEKAVAGRKHSMEIDGRNRKTLEDLMKHEKVLKAGLSYEEVLACRLYTGPMFMKYNASLREMPGAMWDSLKGNRYVTTTHLIVSGIVKMSRTWALPDSRKVYRGMSGILLPDQFRIADEFGCKGGVELGFLSTTTSIEVAVQYTGGKDLPIIFEIDCGMVDRGADLTHLSQYAGECEILFPPLSSLEVVGTSRITWSPKGPITVYPLRINCNTKSCEIETLLNRRKAVHLSLTQNVVDDVRIAYTQDTTTDEGRFVVGMMEGEMARVEGLEARDMNDDGVYRRELNKVLDAKDLSDRIVRLCAVMRARSGGEALVRELLSMPVQSVGLGTVCEVFSGRKGWKELEEGTQRSLPADGSVLDCLLGFECVKRMASRGLGMFQLRLASGDERTVSIDEVEEVLQRPTAGVAVFEVGDDCPLVGPDLTKLLSFKLAPVSSVEKMQLGNRTYDVREMREGRVLEYQDLDHLGVSVLGEFVMCNDVVESLTFDWDPSEENKGVLERHQQQMKFHNEAEQARKAGNHMEAHKIAVKQMEWQRGLMKQQADAEKNIRGSRRGKAWGLARALPHLPTLKSLNSLSLPIQKDDEGEESGAEAGEKEDTSMWKVYAQHVRVWPEVVGAFVSVQAHSSTTLKDLWLQFDFTDVCHGLTVLPGGLSNLTRLSVSPADTNKYECLQPGGVSSVLEALGRGALVEELSFQGCWFGSAGAHELLQGLTRLTCLKVLHIEDNGIEEPMVASLRAAGQNMSIKIQLGDDLDPQNGTSVPSE